MEMAPVCIGAMLTLVLLMSEYGTAASSSTNNNGLNSNGKSQFNKHSKQYFGYVHESLIAAVHKIVVRLNGGEVGLSALRVIYVSINFN